MKKHKIPKNIFVPLVEDYKKFVNDSIENNFFDDQKAFDIHTKIASYDGFSMAVFRDLSDKYHKAYELYLDSFTPPELKENPFISSIAEYSIPIVSFSLDELSKSIQKRVDEAYQRGFENGKKHSIDVLNPEEFLNDILDEPL